MVVPNCLTFKSIHRRWSRDRKYKQAGATAWLPSTSYTPGPSMSISNNPTEVLLQIFHNAVAVSSLQLGSGTAVAFPISQVCRRWRHIALDSPALWDDVRFSSAVYKRSTTMLDEVLSRSGTRPLRVVFSYCEPFQGRQMVDFAPFFHKMVEVCHRFWAIYAMMPRYAMLELSATLGHRIFPLLVHLHLVQNDYLTPAAVTFENAPSLSVVHLENITFCRNRNRSARIALQSQFEDIAAPVMDRIHKLTIIRSPTPIFEPNPVHYPIKIALRSLTLDKMDRTFGLLQFFTTFHMPHLQHIEINMESSKSRFSSQFRRALVSPAIYPALRSAKFTAFSFAHITPEFCHALPALEALVLVDIEPSPLLRLLRADASLCPALHEFSMDGLLRRR
ncbi:hypothetical protein MSAN_01761700 [Mycena sanguinolenta]|uniref:F-box domain-containing protein n=1 Tax=Mycena sanguinolenta TaxID=230812 RepID=A0A8H6XWZ0_9AGAR|nr:hypothetical protein MSAN_01761700 [Mycena sanguinolenta]